MATRYAPANLKIQYPEEWSTRVAEMANELSEDGAASVYGLYHAGTWDEAPFNLIVGKYGPCWQSRVNRGLFLPFDDDARLMKERLEMRVVQLPIDVSLVMSDGHAGFKITHV